MSIFGLNMSYRVHLITQHVEYFKERCASYTEQLGEHMYQNLQIMEQNWLSVGWNIIFLEDYLILGN